MLHKHNSMPTVSWFNQAISIDMDFHSPESYFLENDWWSAEKKTGIELKIWVICIFVYRLLIFQTF